TDHPCESCDQERVCAEREDAEIHARSFKAISATRLPSAKQSCSSSRVSARGVGASPATCVAPYGVPPLVVAASSGSVYGIPVISSRGSGGGSIIHPSVVSCPPCCVPVDVNTAAGLPTSAPDSHSADVPSRKCLSGAEMFPKCPGLPKISPAHSFR